MADLPVRCTGIEVDFDNDDATWRCPRAAAVECWTINGQWEPMCEEHAHGYVLNGRSRPLEARYMFQCASPFCPGHADSGSSCPPPRRHLADDPQERPCRRCGRTPTERATHGRVSFVNCPMCGEANDG